MKITKDNLTFDNVKSFIRGNTNMYLDKLGVEVLEDYEKIQVLLRQTLCSPCVDAGKCLVCNCTTPNLFYDTKRIDSKAKWRQMLNKEEWDKFIKEASDKNVSVDNLEALSLLYSDYYKNSNSTASVKLVKDVTHTVSNASNSSEVSSIYINPERLVKDFKNVKHKSSLNYTFSFPNTTKHTLSISGVNTSCGCTVPSFTNKVSGPGTYLSFTVSYDTNILGAFKRTINPKLRVHDCNNCHVMCPSFVIQGTVVK